MLINILLVVISIAVLALIFDTGCDLMEDICRREEKKKKAKAERMKKIQAFAKQADEHYTLWKCKQISEGKMFIGHGREVK